MKRIFFVFTMMLVFADVRGNIISWPYMHASDYFRGTAGERLFFDVSSPKKGAFYFNNDFRYYHFKHYWDRSGDKYESDRYSRLINLFSFGFMPFDKVRCSVRMPYVDLKSGSLSNSGLSDVFLGLSYQLVDISDRHFISLSSGVKLPVGYYKFAAHKLPLGTGSYDIPFIINSDFQFTGSQLFVDAGYIVIGKSKAIYFSENPEKKFENGDEIFCDIALMHTLKCVVLKLEMNYYHVFDPAPDSPWWSDGQEKFSVVPGIIIPSFIKDLKLDLGYSFDLAGKHTFSGASPVIRVHYQK